MATRTTYICDRDGKEGESVYNGLPTGWDYVKLGDLSMLLCDRCMRNAHSFLNFPGHWVHKF